MNTHTKFRLLLACAVLLAWVGEFQIYLPVADDYPAMKWMGDGLLKFVQQVQQLVFTIGIRRSVGFLFNVPLSSLPGVLPGIVCIVLHLIVTLCLFEVVLLILDNKWLALLAGVLFGVFPFGYGAIVWSMGAYIVWCVGFFFLNLYLLLSHAIHGRLRASYAFALSYIITLLGCLSGEHMVFASLLSGVFVYCIRNRGLPSLSVSKLKTDGWVWAPTLAVLSYLFLALWSQGPMAGSAGHFDKSNINIRTLFSVWFYQLRNLDVFQPWLTARPIAIAFTGWQTIQLLMAVSLLVGVAWLAYSICIAEETKLFDRKACQGHKDSKWVFIVMICMMLGLSSVHMLGGGYSGISRHQYAPISLLMILFSLVASKLQLSFEFSTKQRIQAIGLIIILGVGTTWLVTGVNRYEVRRHLALIDYLSVQNISSPIHIEYDPPLYTNWPKMARTFAHPFEAEWVINEALKYKINRTVEVINDKNALTVKVVWNGQHFLVSSY